MNSSMLQWSYESLISLPMPPNGLYEFFFSFFLKKGKNCKLININQKPGMTSTKNGKQTSNQAEHFVHADM